MNILIGKLVAYQNLLPSANTAQLGPGHLQSNMAKGRMQYSNSTCSLFDLLLVGRSDVL